MRNRDAALEARFKQLLFQSSFIHQSAGSSYAFDAADARAFLVGAANLIEIVTSQRGSHYDQSRQVIEDDRLKDRIPMTAVHAMRGILIATNADFELGLLANMAYVDFAITFDEFLDHAQEFHKGGKVQESAILASAVLEDAMRRIAEKHGVEERTLEPTIDALVKQGVFSPVQARRVKSYASVRTSAFHARWEELDLPAVGAAITGIRELIERYLA